MALTESWTHDTAWLDAQPDDEINRRCDRIENRSLMQRFGVNGCDELEPDERLEDEDDGS